MEALNYILTAIACSSGLFLGAALAVIAKEELKTGQKYFRLTQNILFTGAVALSVYAFRANALIIMLCIAIAAAHAFFKSNFSAYAGFGILFAISSLTNLFLPVASASFLYGFPAGSLMKKEKKTTEQFAVAASAFLLIAVLLKLII